MTISQVEKAIRPQFVLKTGCHWQSARNAFVARMVFIGICDQYGINKGAVTDYLDISGSKYDIQLRQFKKYMKQAIKRRATGKTTHHEDDRYDPDYPSIVYTKSQLVTTYLKLNYGLLQPKYFHLMQIGF